MCLSAALFLSILLLPISDASISSSNWPVILVKVGGSSITDKARKETLRADAVNWIGRTLASTWKMNETCHEDESTHDVCLPSYRYVLVHGAGSYGHFQAKDYSLAGITVDHQNSSRKGGYDPVRYSHAMDGVAKTRLSVQTLNNLVVESLVEQNIPAVGISPCFGALTHGDGDMFDLARIIQKTVQSGLVPVLHGDACLVQTSSVAGILSGDTIMEALGRLPWVSRAIFVTDVDGVFTADPKLDPNAELLDTIQVERETGQVLTEVTASGSSHEHDVTGGLETKLGAAVSIAMSGTDVVIVKCQSKSAELAIHGADDFGVGTRIRAVTLS